MFFDLYIHSPLCLRLFNQIQHPELALLSWTPHMNISSWSKGQGISLTTVFLPSGRYRYLCFPMGLSGSSDDWLCSAKSTVKQEDHWRHPYLGLKTGWLPFSNAAPSLMSLFLQFELGDRLPFLWFIIAKDRVRPDPIWFPSSYLSIRCPLLPGARKSIGALHPWFCTLYTLL